MAKKRYVLGIDFGTESARALLVDAANGREAATAVARYPHGVIDDALPGFRRKLPRDSALQHPQDYLTTLRKTVRAVLRQSGVAPAQVIGIGIDFTACTMLPIDRDGLPLCLQKSFADEPQAWVKLWKHHAAQPQATAINALARERGETFLERYGGVISSEWLLPKIWETLVRAPRVYEAADRFIEAADWVVLHLTGVEARNACCAGYKGMWDKDEGYPSPAFLRALDPRLETLVRDKLSTAIYPAGAKAGELLPAAARELGLAPGTAVAVACIDAHAAVPGASVTDAGTMVIIMGTSFCHMICAREKRVVPGTSGVVEDGILPGLYGFEGGQAAGGDIFAWFIDNALPASVRSAARKEGLSIHEYLARHARALKVGESGMIALDWWNGNRSVLVDAQLSGMVLGYTLQTGPVEVYRTLLEATAFGTRKIIDTFEAHGVAINDIVACGGLPDKNPFFVQIVSDVTNRPIKVAESPQASALGAAMWGAVAAGAAVGGYDSIQAAAKKMARVRRKGYQPDAGRARAYDRLYAEYEVLHDYFGRGTNEVMKRLRSARAGGL